MGEFDYSGEAVRRVFIATLFIVVVGGIVSQLVMRNAVAAALTTATKALLFAACYVAFYDSFTSAARPDDIVYLRQGAHLLDQLQTRPWSEISLIHTAESFHFFYIIPVALALWLFGEHYFSMVALNIVLSFLCGALAFAIIQFRYKDRAIACFFFLLVTLSPDLLAWTSFFAGKDTWVLLGHLLFIYGFACIDGGRGKRGTLWIALAVLLTVNLRFYVPIFMLGLIGLTLNRRTKYWLVGFTILALVAVPDTARALLSLMRSGIGALSIDILGLVIAVPRFWLTPRPFLTDELHGFLFVPSLINWMLVPIMLAGLYRCLLAKDRLARFLAYYFLVFSLFYGITDVLNGPRQRLQLLFAQMFFLWAGLAYTKVLPSRLRLPGIAGRPADGSSGPPPPDVAPAY